MTRFFVPRLIECLALATAWLPFGRLAPAAESAEKTPIVTTGAAVPKMTALDDAMTSLLRKWEIPGGSLAVMKDGRLVFARGYGFADRELKQPVQPDSLFRVASVSKPITAAAVLVLVEQKRLDLDAKALDVLKPILPAEKPAERAMESNHDSPPSSTSGRF